MSRYLTILIFLSPTFLVGQGLSPEKTKLPAISLLPDGSQLKKVMLPRYDELQNLVGVLKADTMTLVNAEMIAGSNVTLLLYNPDQSPRGRVDLKNAVFNQVKGIVEAKETVIIKSERLTAQGSGLVYSYTTGEGFLQGPAITTIQNPTETTMQTPRNMLPAAALVGLALVAQPLVAASPPHLTSEEQTTLKADAISKVPILAAANSKTQKVIAEAATVSNKANSASAAFRADAKIPNPEQGNSESPAATPLEVDPSSTQTLITCDGGIYFDADEGLLVYSKNVVVKDPRFDLTGADELKVFLSKKDPAASGKPDIQATEKPMANVGAGFGDVERILATGAVRLLQKQVERGKPPIEASGAIFNYNIKSGEIIITGGFPWIKQGKNFLRATKPNLNLRIQKSGSFATEGNWQMGGELNQKK